MCHYVRDCHNKLTISTAVVSDRISNTPHTLHAALMTWQRSWSLLQEPVETDTSEMTLFEQTKQLVWLVRWFLPGYLLLKKYFIKWNFLDNNLWIKTAYVLKLIWKANELWTSRRSWCWHKIYIQDIYTLYIYIPNMYVCTVYNYKNV